MIVVYDTGGDYSCHLPHTGSQPPATVAFWKGSDDYSSIPRPHINKIVFKDEDFFQEIRWVHLHTGNVFLFLIRIYNKKCRRRTKLFFKSYYFICWQIVLFYAIIHKQQETIHSAHTLVGKTCFYSTKKIIIFSKVQWL